MMKNKLLTEQIVGEYTVADSMVLDSRMQYTEQLFYKVKIEDRIFDVVAFEYDFFQEARRLIEASDFKPLPYPVFREHISQLYNVDIDTMYAYYPNSDLDHPEDIITHAGFLILTNGCIGEHCINEEAIIHYNNMILYDDSIAFAWMKTNAPYNIIRQVKELGVTSNPKWLKFAFDKSNFWQEFTLHDYVFGNSYDDEKYHIRKNMLDTMINYGVDLSLLSGVLESVESEPEMYAGNANELAGYLYTKIDEIGQCGYIEYRLDNDPELIKKFKDNKYYGSSELQFFCDEVYETKAERRAKGKGSCLEPEPSFKISDPDGFVNMRKEANANSEIITTIPNDEFLAVLQTMDECKKLNWWKVEYEEKTGFIHKSRIIVISKNAHLFK